MQKVTLGYQKSELGNVGDDLNPWLLKRLLPNVSFGDSDRLLLCIGSILVSDRWDGYARKIVLGSGAKALNRLPKLDESWDIRFVRGPNTASALAVDFITDPALLLGRFASASKVRKGVGIVPYYRSDHRFWRAMADSCGATLISPRMALEPFIEALGKCEMVICEAMHGSIFADALRIPWRPIALQNVGFEGDAHNFKWSDWTRSVGLEFDPLHHPVSSMESGPPFGPIARLQIAWDLRRNAAGLRALLNDAIQQGNFVLSPDSIYEDRCGRLADAFAKVNHEFK